MLKADPHTLMAVMCALRNNVPEAVRGLTSYPGEWRPEERHDLHTIKHLIHINILEHNKITEI